MNRKISRKSVRTNGRIDAERCSGQVARQMVEVIEVEGVYKREAEKMVGEMAEGVIEEAASDNTGEDKDKEPKNG